MTEVWSIGVVYDAGRIVGGFTVEDALDVARNLEASGRQVLRLEAAGTVILEGDELRRAMSDLSG